MHDRLDAARQHQRVAHRRVALDVGLLGIDQQPLDRLALPARQIGCVEPGELQPRLVVGEATHPVALLQQEFAAPHEQRRIVGPVGQRHVEIGQRTDPLAARFQQPRAGDQRRHQAMVGQQRFVIGALGLLESTERLQCMTAIVADRRIVGL